MANKCPEREGITAEPKKKTLKKCLNCGIKGHLAKYCWYKEFNKSKRPSAFVKKLEKRNEETAAAGMDNGIQEYLLGLAENDGEGLLEDPDLWIADTAATAHMTPYQSDLMNLRTTTWAMKKKTSGEFRARINARGFKQVDGIH
jgi:hypothetical protein